MCSFTQLSKKFNPKRFEDIIEAIKHKKKLKHFLRVDKIELIKSMNHDWNDLYSTII